MQLLSLKIKQFQTGFIYHYALSIFIGFLICSLGVTFYICLDNDTANFILSYVDFRVIIVLIVNLLIYLLRSSKK
jgi:hypothetical protein